MTIPVRINISTFWTMLLGHLRVNKDACVQTVVKTWEHLVIELIEWQIQDSNPLVFALR